MEVLPLPEGCDATQGRKFYGSLIGILYHGSLVEGSDGGLYCAPLEAQGVLRVDPQSQSASLLPLPEGCDATRGWKWHGSLVEGSDGGLYCAPSCARGVLRVDPQSQSTSLLPLPEGCDATRRANWEGSL
eukprot:COSAG02_NODE_29536_length_567_cov_1.241453_1_plen_129_part_10